jgi:hypothetical protein
LPKSTNNLIFINKYPHLYPFNSKIIQNEKYTIENIQAPFYNCINC